MNKFGKNYIEKADETLLIWISKRTLELLMEGEKYSEDNWLENGDQE